MDFAHSILFALFGGIVPSIIWVLFWLREDKAHPEPAKRIIEAYLGGIACVILAIPIEGYLSHLIGQSDTSPLLFIVLAATEEILKFTACYFIALRTIDDDEPIDAVIYMIITALGFAAFENSLFIFTPLYSQTVSVALATGQLRFIGASLLHILSSATVGIFIAFSFYKPGIHLKIYAVLGLFFATILHTLFNIGVMDKTSGGPILFTFAILWIGIIGLIILLEKIKGMVQ